MRLRRPFIQIVNSKDAKQKFTGDNIIDELILCFNPCIVVSSPFSAFYILWEGFSRCTSFLCFPLSRSFKKLLQSFKKLRLFVRVRYIFQWVHWWPPMTRNGGQATSDSAMDSAMLPFTRVQIAVRNYYSRPGLTPRRWFAPCVGEKWIVLHIQVRS